MRQILPRIRSPPAGPATRRKPLSPTRPRASGMPSSWWNDAGQGPEIPWLGPRHGVLPASQHRSFGMIQALTRPPSVGSIGLTRTWQFQFAFIKSNCFSSAPTDSVAVKIQVFQVILPGTPWQETTDVFRTTYSDTLSFIRSPNSLAGTWSMMRGTLHFHFASCAEVPENSRGAWHRAQTCGRGFPERA